MRKSIVTVAFVLGLQGVVLPAAATDRPTTDRATSEMSNRNADSSTQQTRVAEASTDKSFERSAAEDSKDSGRAKQIRVYFFFGGR
jgi:hypothetical protein